MKKITTVTIASAVILMLMGCGETAHDPANLELSTTAISSPDSTSDEGDTTSQAESSDSSPADEGNTTSDDNSDEDSGEVNSELTEDQFVYKGKTVSILDDNDRILQNLGAFNPELTVNADLQSMYIYGENEITYNALKEEGVEYPYILDVETDSISTSRGIKVGNTKEEVTAAYGEAEETKSGDLSYSFDGFDIIFGFENGKVCTINYKNISTASKFDEWD